MKLFEGKKNMMECFSEKSCKEKKVTIRILQRMKYWGCYSDILFPILEVIITSILKPTVYKWD